MGWKKLLKKATSPIAEVLDKIIPNEIKPFLPYMAAFAPYMMGPGAGGIFSGIGIHNKMLQRALMSGTFNLGSQLAQEGSEGEFSGLSALLAAGQGALTARGAADTLRGFKPSTTTLPGQASAPLTDRMLSGGLEGLAKSSEFLGKGVDMFSPEGVEPGLNLATLEAAALPVSQATGDLALAEGQRALRDYENEMANQDQLSLIDDDGRRRAIRAAMEASNHLEQTILDTLAELGLKQGGIVGMKHGGRIGFEKGGDTERKKKAKEIADTYGVTLSTAYRILRDLEDMTTGNDWTTEPYSVEELMEKKYLDPNIKEYAGDAFGIGPTFTKKSIEKNLDTYFDKAKDILKDIDYRSDDYKTLKTPSKIGTPGMLTIENVQSQNPWKNMAHGGVASVLPKGREADYRGGGVIPVGSRERADDVPARLSKNEFVMTADAVRAAGGGSINKGAKRMYNLMHNLEARV